MHAKVRKKKKNKISEYEKIESTFYVNGVVL